MGILQRAKSTIYGLNADLAALALADATELARAQAAEAALTQAVADGQQLSVRYAYGSMDSHLKESNPHPQYVLQQQLGTSLAGYPVSLASSLQLGDHLEFDGSKWANTSKTTLVDGGNF